MPHFLLHNSSSPGDVILSRSIIQLIKYQFPDIELTLETSESCLYLWQDLGLPIQSYDGESYHGIDATQTCPLGAHFINLGFGVFEDLQTLYGMTHDYYIHAYNRQVCQYQLQHQCLLPLQIYSPMVIFPNQFGIGFDVKPNSVLVENCALPTDHNYFYLDEQLGQIAAKFPDLTFYCAFKPLSQADNVVNCSGLNLVELSWLSDRCISLLTKGGDVNAATYTEANRFKPRCIVGWNLPIRLWNDTARYTSYVENLDQVIEFLSNLTITFNTMNISSTTERDQSSNKPARLQSFCKFLLSRTEIDECTQYLLENGYLSHLQDCKNWDLATILPDLSDGNLLDMGSSDSSLLQNVIHKQIKGEKYGIDLREPTHPVAGVNYVVGDLMDTQLPDDFFQTITCLSVLEHGVNFTSFSQEVSRLLKDGGKLYLTFDYANPKVRSQLEMYNLDWNILDADDVETLVDCCRSHGLVLVQDIDWSVRDAVIDANYWSPDPNVSYTFGMLTFKKVSSAIPESSNSSMQPLNLSLSAINWIAFPDWTVSEELLMSQLSDLVRLALVHPDRHQLTLLVDANGAVLEDANLMLSGVMMDLLMDANNADSETISESKPEPTIVLLEPISDIQRHWLQPQLHYRVALQHENLARIASLSMDALPVINLRYFAEFNTDKFIRERYFPDFSYVGTMIEVGGATPDYLSMSKHFRLNGWRTIVIEPNPTFADLHRAQGNEVYEYACSYDDRDNVPFQVVNWLGNFDYHSSGITDHSFSALSVKESYLKKHNYESVDSLSYTEISVNVRRLDTIINQINLNKIDLVSIDVEGWELEVIQGFSVSQFKPKVIVLENYLHDEEYTEAMKRLGYQLDARIEYNYVYISI